MKVKTMFRIEFTKTAYQHLQQLKQFDRNRILDSIKSQLPYQPQQETRHRKMLRPNQLADWELRVDDYRVFYDINEAQNIVRIIAVGLKQHNQLIIDGKEITL